LSEVTEGTGHILDRLDAIGLALETGFRDRLTHMREVGAEWSVMIQGLASDGHASGFYLALVLGTVLLSVAIYHAVRAVLGRIAFWPKRFPTSSNIITAILTLAIILIILRAALPDGTERHIARAWCFVTVIGLFVERVITRLIGNSPKAEPVASPTLGAFARLLIIGLGWSLFGLAAMASLRA